VLGELLHDPYHTSDERRKATNGVPKSAQNVKKHRPVVQSFASHNNTKVEKSADQRNDKNCKGNEKVSGHDGSFLA
jgi:hypothetical protein